MANAKVHKNQPLESSEEIKREPLKQQDPVNEVLRWLKPILEGMAKTRSHKHTYTDYKLSPDYKFNPKTPSDWAFALNDKDSFIYKLIMNVLQERAMVQELINLFLERVCEHQNKIAEEKRKEFVSGMVSKMLLEKKQAEQADEREKEAAAQRDQKLRELSDQQLREMAIELPSLIQTYYKETRKLELEKKVMERELRVNSDEIIKREDKVITDIIAAIEEGDLVLRVPGPDGEPRVMDALEKAEAVERMKTMPAQAPMAQVLAHAPIAEELIKQVADLQVLEEQQKQAPIPEDKYKELVQEVKKEITQRENAIGMKRAMQTNLLAMIHAGGKKGDAKGALAFVNANPELNERVGNRAMANLQDNVENVKNIIPILNPYKAKVAQWQEANDKLVAANGLLKRTLQNLAREEQANRNAS